MSDLATDINVLRPVRQYLRTSGAPYLSVLFVSVVLSQFAQYLAPTQVILKGQPAVVLTNYLLVGLAFALWLLFKPTDTWPPIFRWFLAALAIIAGWTNSPISGVGETGITAAIGALVVILVVAIAIVIALRAGRRGFAIGAAIIATSIVDGLSEDLVEWRYLSIALVPIVLAAMLAATWLVDNPRERR